MNDLAGEDLGDPAPVVVPFKKRANGKKAAKPKAKAKAPKKAKSVTEVVDEFERDQRVQAAEKGKNRRGLEGFERVTKAFLIEYQGLLGDLNKARSRIATRCLEAKNDGVPVRHVKRLLKEIDKPETCAVEQNIMNELRKMVSLPHGEAIDDTSTYGDEDSADARAYEAGRQHVWRGGRSQDNPYHGDVKRGQEWLRGFNDCFAEAEAASSVAAMKKLHALATEAAKAASA